MRFIVFNVDFIREGRAHMGPPQIMKFTKFNNCSYSWNKANKVWLPPAEEDLLREHNYANFHSMKKTTRTNIGA